MTVVVVGGGCSSKIPPSPNVAACRQGSPEGPARVPKRAEPRRPPPPRPPGGRTVDDALTADVDLHALPPSRSHLCIQCPSPPPRSRTRSCRSRRLSLSTPSRESSRQASSLSRRRLRLGGGSCRSALTGFSLALSRPSAGPAPPRLSIYAVLLVLAGLVGNWVYKRFFYKRPISKGVRVPPYVSLPVTPASSAHASAMLTDPPPSSCLFRRLDSSARTRLGS
jgi:hypothetical protein